MKILRIKIKNIGLIADETIELNKPLLLFYGEIRNGKTTILNAFRWVCGGEFPTDIIRHGQKQASIEVDIDGGCITRSFYVPKEGGATKARPVTFVREGKPVSNPTSEIKRFLNPFLLNQDHLRNMTELERKRYFAELFAVDTTELDKELFNSERKASELRAEIKGFGELNPVKVEPVDVVAVKVQREKILADHAANVAKWKAERDTILKAHEAEMAEVEKQHAAASARSDEIRQQNARISQGKITIARLENELAEAKELNARIEQWLGAHPAIIPLPKPTSPDVALLNEKIYTKADTESLDAKISEAAAVQVRVEQYQRDFQRLQDKLAKQTELEKCEARQRKIKAEKIAKLKGVSESSGIAELEFAEDGTFTYQGTQAGMLSTSQIMQLSSALSALYPEGFGIELLDRGESLGKSIFDFVEKAKAQKTTILATIVGERPARVPPEIGVFVVNDGKVTETTNSAEGTLL